ncbi:MAG TPA: hypothetical protein VK841_11605 [Polyangiaceae bacterium]|nr:hypothetical protein [Polyangiaceae bacterium]
MNDGDERPGQTSRELVALSTPDDVQTAGGRKGFVDHLAVVLVPLVNAERARRGLPPLRRD